jgi:hypothetical protein
MRCMALPWGYPAAGVGRPGWAWAADGDQKTTQISTEAGTLAHLVYNVTCTCIKLYSCWFQFRLTVVPSSVVLFSFLRFQFLVSSAFQA